MNASILKRGLTGLALVGTAGLLAACGAAPTPGDSSGAPSDASFLACAVSDEGSWDDKSFNQAAYEGLTKAVDELGVEKNDAESASPEEFEPNLNAMVDAGCDLTFAIGFNFSLGGTSGNGLIFDFADAHPDDKFAWLDGWPGGTADNVKPIMYSSEQGSYLAGYLAAAYSTTKVVGTWGGMQIDSVTSFMDGFYLGAQKWAEDNGTAVKVVGWDPATASGDFVGDFANTEVAKTISLGQLSQGADVIFPVAGGLFTATAEAIREAAPNAVLLGVDKDIALTQPQLADITLTSVEKRMTQAVYDIIEGSVDGDFSTEPYIGTLENDGTGLSPFYDFDSKVPQEVKDALEEISAQITDGTITIPLTKNPAA